MLRNTSVFDFNFFVNPICTYMHASEMSADDNRNQPHGPGIGAEMIEREEVSAKEKKGKSYIRRRKEERQRGKKENKVKYGNLRRVVPKGWLAGV